MNPLASTKCARRVLIALAAVSGLFFAVGCGNSSSTPPINPVGFSTSSLSGTYVFSSEGVDADGAPLAVAGTLVANGSGGITGGTMDVVDAQDSTTPTPVTISSGSYTVGADGRGQASLSGSSFLGASLILDFVLTSTSHGLVTEFDGDGTGSGTIDLQTAVTSLSQLAGPYAFNLAGVDGNFDPFATAGAFTLNSSGASTAGVEDFNDDGAVYPGKSLTVPATTLGSGTGPGSITLSSYLGALTFDFYPIDATHLKFIETDFTNILAGDVFTQTGASIPSSGSMVFTMAGSTGVGPIAEGGVMTSTGGGNFSGGLEDLNNNGAVSPAQLQFTGSAAAGGSVGGRVIVNLTGYDPGPDSQWVVYPSSGGLLMLETDSLAVTTGAAYAQTSTALAASQPFGFNLSAVDLGNGSPFEEDDIAQFTTTSSGFGGIVDINDEGTTTFDQAFVGTYTATIDSTGRGTATTTEAGNAYVSFTFYAVSNTQFLVLETDTTQIGAGTFELQSAPGAGGAARAHIAMVHPVVRAHGAFRRK
jgi:hypothetical protein